jgi:hypothetical protein
MRELRNHPNPAQRKSRNELAKMFGCTQFFVGIAAPLEKEAVKEIYRERERQKANWGVRKQFFRDVRQKRLEAWKNSEE